MAESSRGLSDNLKASWRWFWLSARAILSRRRIADSRGFATVTLTTHGPRQWSAMLAVDSLSRGRVRPARVVLFLDGRRYDRSRLPFPLALLVRRGVDVVCLDRDYGSYTKLPLFAWFPAPEQLPVITIDDDMIYPRGWLDSFRTEAADGTACVLCHRARRMRFDAAGNFAPYLQWDFAPVGVTKYDILPLGVYGVLYRREALDAIRGKGTAFLELAPNVDDLWFRLCTLERGLLARTLNTSRSVWQAVPFTEDTALWPDNVLRGGNDQKLACIAPMFDLSVLREARGAAAS